MQKITPFFWFADQAEEAVNFYVSIFKHSRIVSVVRYGEAAAKASGRKLGSVMTVKFELVGQEFVALNGGPVFTFSPAISLHVNCETEAEVDGLWRRLSEGGTVLMGLAAYPFSEKFGWVTDKLGVSWQLNLGRRTQKILPFLMFTGVHYGHAEAAIHVYADLFDNSKVLGMEHYRADEGEPVGTVKRAAFQLHGQEFMAIDSHFKHGFTFTPALSLVVNCETQAEVDELWEKLGTGGQPGQCAWLTDKHGVTWQIVPTVLIELLADTNSGNSEKVMQAMLQMGKIDIKTLQAAAGR